ncbi:MAG: hypothetical protein KZQ92_18775, partial [Candidatus Thiodiazotropha sp. (ex Lucinoma borealis)]|nr:hypothetical protein [Candidatus Thiodiazotropha sp. (ex Lucinoma borealis)]
SGLKYVTPEQRHRGQDTALLEARSQLYLKATGLNRRGLNRTSTQIRLNTERSNESCNEG